MQESNNPKDGAQPTEANSNEPASQEELVKHAGELLERTSAAIFGISLLFTINNPEGAMKSPDGEGDDISALKSASAHKFCELSNKLAEHLQDRLPNAELDPKPHLLAWIQYFTDLLNPYNQQGIDIMHGTNAIDRAMAKTICRMAGREIKHSSELDLRTAVLVASMLGKNTVQFLCSRDPQLKRLTEQMGFSQGLGAINGVALQGVKINKQSFNEIKEVVNG